MIRVNRLVKFHGRARVLDGVDLTVGRGEVAALIGPSGGGKSTLLRCINALETFQEGSIDVADVHLQGELSPRSSDKTLLNLRRRVGMVFQQFNLFPHLSALDNVTVGPRLAMGWDRERARAEGARLLERVGLGDKGGARPEQLSGGQQQRVAIARALAVQPQAILFDEPTSALDPRMAAEVLAVIADLARGGLTMVVVTHSMTFASQVAHAVHVLQCGKIAESGPPEQIFGAPQTAVTKQFLSESTHC